MNSELLLVLLYVHFQRAVDESDEVHSLFRKGLIRTGKGSRLYETTDDGERVIAGAITGASTVL